MCIEDGEKQWQMQGIDTAYMVIYCILRAGGIIGLGKYMLNYIMLCKQTVSKGPFFANMARQKKMARDSLNRSKFLFFRLVTVFFYCRDDPMT